jgi:hypothetical protein
VTVVLRVQKCDVYPVTAHFSCSNHKIYKLYKMFFFKYDTKYDLQVLFMCSQVASCTTGNGGKFYHILCVIVCCARKGHHEPRACGTECQLCFAGRAWASLYSFVGCACNKWFLKGSASECGGSGYNSCLIFIHTSGLCCCCCFQ